MEGSAAPGLDADDELLECDALQQAEAL